MESLLLFYTTKQAGLYARIDTWNPFDFSLSVGTTGSRSFQRLIRVRASGLLSCFGRPKKVPADGGDKFDSMSSAYDSSGQIYARHSAGTYFGSLALVQFQVIPTVVAVPMMSKVTLPTSVDTVTSMVPPSDALVQPTVVAPTVPRVAPVQLSETLFDSAFSAIVLFAVEATWKPSETCARMR